MIKFKDNSVCLSDLKPQLVLVLVGIVAPVFAEHGSENTVITSANDSKHSTNSRHWDGAAVDLRIWHLDDPAGVADRLNGMLGQDFDCIFEGDHIHLEYQPKYRKPF